jgi:inhibitor of cysteine peptidase
MMRIKKPIGLMFVLLLVASIIMAGCISTESDQENNKQITPDTPPSEIYLFDGTNNNETYTITQDSLIYIKLEENPTTGYEWEITTTDGLVVMSDTYEPSDTSGQKVGAGGIHEWELHAQEPGTYTFDAIYKRNWEETTGEEDTYSLTLIIG